MRRQRIGLLAKSLLLVALILSAPSLWAQVSVVKGKVVDARGEAVIGAGVVEVGKASNGAVTDLDGLFTLSVQSSSLIEVSCIGYKSQVLKPEFGATMQIVLEDDAELVEEAVVLGYSSRARRDLTGSVGSVSGAKLAAVPVTSAAVALQGKIAGVQITTVDGAPGADINIRVRGATSVTQSNDPLFIVDGFQTDNINDIPPTDIASIDILKDASLTAIYGARGGNGVIVVTTKSAKSGKVQVSFNGQTSISHLSKRLEVLDTYEFVRYQYDWAAANGNRSSNAKYFRGNFGNPYDLDLYKGAVTHDWQSEVMGETPVNYSANVNVGGGNDRVRFNLSLTNSKDDGIIMGSGVNRTNINLKMNILLSDKLTLTINPKLSIRNQMGAGGDNIGTGGVINVLKYRPTNGLREFAWWDERFVDPDDEEIFQYTNPKSDIQYNTQTSKSVTSTYQAALEWRPIKNLSLRSEFGYSFANTQSDRFYGAMTSTGQSNNKLPVAQINKGSSNRILWTNTANYSFSKGRSNWSFLLGQEIQHSQSESTTMRNRYFPRNISADRALKNMALGTPQTATSTVSTPDRMASFFGQANWNFDHRYLLSATMRADGSTKFAPGNQWGYFPSISGGWVANKEEFLRDAYWLSNLKLRFAVGMAGNNRISSDMWRYLYSVATSGGPGFGEVTPLGEQYYTNAGGNTYSNRDVKWETTLTRNLAIDIGLLKERITITPEVYWNTTTDLLYQSTIASTTGYGIQMQNIGQVTNKGFELTANGDILRGSDFVLSANLTFGFNKTVVDKLNSTDDVIATPNTRWKSIFSDEDGGDYRLKVGDQVGLIYGFVYDGLYSMDEFDFDATQNFLAVPKEGTIINEVSAVSNSGDPTLPGKIKFKDLNGDGKITKEDRTVIGNTNPMFQGGFGLSGQWKGFDFNVNFYYMYDFDIVNATAYDLSSSEGNSKKFNNVLSKFSYDNRWTYVHLADDFENGWPMGEILYKNYYIDQSVAKYAEINAGKTLWNPTDVTNKVLHSYFIEDGSFIRCQDITVGYTLPESVSKKIGMSRLRIYLNCTNPFIITNYSGYDPEVDVQTGLSCGMDFNRYPRNRSYVFGLNITF